MRNPLWALLEDFTLLLFGLVILLSPIALAATIAYVVYGLLTGEMNIDAAVVFIVWSTFYVSIIAQLSRLIPEGFPTLDLAMTVFLTAFGGAFALFALATPWWALELERAARAAGGQTYLPVSLLLVALAIASAYVTGKEAWRFHSRYKTRYPGLETVLKNLEASAPHLREEVLGAVRRGQVAFLYNENEKVTHVLVGQALFPVHPGRKRYSPGNIREAPNEKLVEYLQKRTSLSALPPERILALLQGRGSARDFAEVERVWAMERLSGF
jgi:hypothetical protein